MKHCEHCELPSRAVSAVVGPPLGSFQSFPALTSSGWSLLFQRICKHTQALEKHPWFDAERERGLPLQDGEHTYIGKHTQSLRNMPDC